MSGVTEQQQKSTTAVVSSSTFQRITTLLSCVMSWCLKKVQRFSTYVYEFATVPNIFGNAMCKTENRLDGKTVVVTGCNTGIGKFTAMEFYRRGGRVIMACRNVKLAEEAAEDIKNTCRNDGKVGELIINHLDLSNLESVRECAKTILEKEKRLDLLLNNAGVMMCPYSLTRDGFEMQMGTNHLGHYLLTLLLLPKLVQSPSARIVNVSSLAHAVSEPINFDDLNWQKRKYSSIGAYEQSKLANVLFTKELARRLKDRNIHHVTTYSLHPGVIKTELGRHLNRTFIPGVTEAFQIVTTLMFKSVEQGAQTSIHCSLDDACSQESGLYYHECQVREPSKLAMDTQTQRRLWEVSWELVGLDKNYDPFKI